MELSLESFLYALGCALLLVRLLLVHHRMSPETCEVVRWGSLALAGAAAAGVVYPIMQPEAMTEGWLHIAVVWGVLIHQVTLDYSGTSILRQLWRKPAEPTPPPAPLVQLRRVVGEAFHRSDK